MSTEALIKAIDAYSEAHEARQCCPPEMKERYDNIAESQHRKVCEAMGIVDREGNE